MQFIRLSKEKIMADVLICDEGKESREEGNLVLN